MKEYSDIEFLKRVHENAPIDLHANILFGNLHVAGIPFAHLYSHCMHATRTGTTGWKVFRRAQRAFNLARYYEYASSLQGDKIECGVFNGFSALMCCHIGKALDPKFDGAGFYLCDSFEGLSQPTKEDLISTQVENGDTREFWAFEKGRFATDMQTVMSRFTEFPGVVFAKGWIPPVLSKLPEKMWSFVHIDVDLYEPTMACLEYFFPRLSKGAVIVNDDFGSPLFPGGGKSWKDFFERKNLSYVVLDTGQSVYIHG